MSDSPHRAAHAAAAGGGAGHRQLVRNAQANVLRGTVLSSTEIWSRSFPARSRQLGRVTASSTRWTPSFGHCPRAEIAALAHLGLGARPPTCRRWTCCTIRSTWMAMEISIKELTAVVRPSNALQDTMPGNLSAPFAPPKAEPAPMTPHTRERVAAQRERAGLAAQNQLRDGSARRRHGHGGGRAAPKARPLPTAATCGSQRLAALERPVSTPRQGFRPARARKLTDAEWFEANKANAPKPSPRDQAGRRWPAPPVPPARWPPTSPAARR